MKKILLMMLSLKTHYIFLNVLDYLTKKIDKISISQIKELILN